MCVKFEFLKYKTCDNFLDSKHIYFIILITNTDNNIQNISNNRIR